MPTQTKENYLKSLFYLHAKNHEISITDLGEDLNVSKPTVNDMVKKLAKDGWVIYKKYKPLQLTEKGKKISALVVRKHRLSEMFLSKIMGFGWEEVHEMAEELEHIKSEEFFDRMDQLLGFPSIDPHGSPIPDKSGNFSRPNYQLLSQIKSGQSVVLKALRDSSTEFLLFLNKKEISLGTKIDVEQIEEFDKSMVISYNNQKNIMLSHSVCRRLLVEP